MNCQASQIRFRKKKCIAIKVVNINYVRVKMNEDGYGESGGDAEAHGDGNEKPPTAGAAVVSPTKIQTLAIILRQKIVNIGLSCLSLQVALLKENLE